MNHIDSKNLFAFEAAATSAFNDKESSIIQTAAADDESIILLPPPRKLNHKYPRRLRTTHEKLEMAAQGRLRYQNLPLEKKKEKNQRRSEAYRRKKEMIDKLLATPVSECTPEMLEIVKKYMIEQHRRNEKAKNRYANMTPDERRVYNSKRTQYNDKKRDLAVNEK